MDLDLLSGLLFQLGSPHDFFVQPVADSVYHYTDLPGLHGIVSGGDLWLTDTRYANDSEEMHHGFSTASSVIARLSTAPATGKQQKAFLRKVGASLEESRDLGVYVSCFCMDDDLLGQWRSYGANGTGVSLKMATSGFEFVAGPDMPPATFGLMYLWRVFYDRARQEALLENCLDMVWNGVGTQREKVELATDALRFFIPTFKNPAFVEEREARLVFAPAADCPVLPLVRVVGEMLVPYFSLRALAVAAGRGDWRLPIEAVRVGPSAFQDGNRRSAELFLRGAGYEQAEVSVSDVPYRG